MRDRIYQHPAVHCPHCGQRVSAAYEHPGNPDRRPPRSGDFSVCWACMGVSVFLVSPFGVTLRKATDADMDALTADHPNLLGDARRYKRQFGR